MQIIFFSDLKFSNFNNLVKKHNYKFKVKNIVGGTVLVNEKQGSLIDIGSKKISIFIRKGNANTIKSCV